MGRNAEKDIFNVIKYNESPFFHLKILGNRLLFTFEFPIGHRFLKKVSFVLKTSADHNVNMNLQYG